MDMKLKECGEWYDVYECPICGKQMTLPAEELAVPVCLCEAENA